MVTDKIEMISSPLVEEGNVSRWEYEASRFCVSRFLYRPWNEIWMPHFEVSSTHGFVQVVPFFGEVVYKLREDRVCTRCFTKLRRSTYYSLCDDCLQAQQLYFLKCYEKGVGLGGGECDFERPECSSDFCSYYCRADFILYVGILEEGRIKVGITKRETAFFKLLEEGVSYGATFSLPRDSIQDAIQMRDRVVRECHWRHYFSFSEKVDFYSKGKEIANGCQVIDMISQQLHDSYELEKEASWNLRNYALNIPGQIDFSIRLPLELVGTLDGFWGSIGFFQRNGKRLAFDMKTLMGHVLENVIG